VVVQLVSLASRYPPWVPERERERQKVKKQNKTRSYSSGVNESWSGSVYILKKESMGVVGRLNVY
jgi:hypothetical protein